MASVRATVLRCQRRSALADELGSALKMKQNEVDVNDKRHAADDNCEAGRELLNASGG
jgi:hypothetical protein